MREIGNLGADRSESAQRVAAASSASAKTNKSVSLLSRAWLSRFERRAFGDCVFAAFCLDANAQFQQLGPPSSKQLNIQSSKHS